MCHVPHIFSLGLAIYRFHTNVSPNILLQKCAHDNTIISISANKNISYTLGKKKQRFQQHNKLKNILYNI